MPFKFWKISQCTGIYVIFLLPARIGNRAFFYVTPHSRAVWRLAAIGEVWEGLGRFGKTCEYLGFQYCRIGFRRIRGLYGEYSLLLNYRYPPLFTVQHNGTVQKNKRKEGWGLRKNCKYGKCWKLQEAACKVNAWSLPCLFFCKAPQEK